MLISTGTLGVVINAIQKARDRKSDERINKLIKGTTDPIRTQIETMSSQMGEVVINVKDINNKVKQQEKSIKQLTNDFNRHTKTSRKVDMILTRALHDKQLINGESEKIYNILFEEDEQDKRVINE